MACNYDKVFENLPLTIQQKKSECISGLHLYVVRLLLDKIGKTRSDVHKELLDSGIGVNLHYFPVHLQPWFSQYGFEEGDFPEAESYSKSAVSIPLYYDLTAESQEKVISEIARILR